MTNPNPTPLSPEREAEIRELADRTTTLGAITASPNALRDVLAELDRTRTELNEMGASLRRAAGQLADTQAELATARTLAARCPHGCSDCEDHEREVARTGADPTPGQCPACEDRRPGAQRGDR